MEPNRTLIAVAVLATVSYLMPGRADTTTSSRTFRNPRVRYLDDGCPQTYGDLPSFISSTFVKEAGPGRPEQKE